MREKPGVSAKKQLIQMISDGMTVAAACEVIGKHPKTYEYYRKTDVAFADAVDAARDGKRGRLAKPDVSDFPEFSERFFG